MAFDINRAKAAIEGGMGEAQELIKDPAKVDDLLVSLEATLKNVPLAGDTLANIPLTISLVKSYITKEYTEVSPKVIISLLSAFVYLLKKKDIIPDNVPLLGQVDDVAVLGFALKFVEPELKAYAQWRDSGKGTTQAAPAEEAQAAPAQEAPEQTAETAGAASAAEASEETAEAPAAEAPAATVEAPAEVPAAEAPAAEASAAEAPAETAEA